jgi:hypothetical protein
VSVPITVPVVRLSCDTQERPAVGILDRDDGRAERKDNVVPSIGIVALLLAVALVALAYRDERLGRAIAVGAATVAALYVILGPVPAGNAQQSPAPATSSDPSGS